MSSRVWWRQRQINDLSYPQRSSSSIQRLDRPQLPTTIIQLYPKTQQISTSRYDRPAVFYDSTASYPHQTSSFIFTAHPTPATLIEYPAAHIYDSTIPAIDINHLAEDPNTTTTDLTHVCRSDNKLKLLLCLLARFCFLHCLWLSLLARFNLKTFAGSMCLSALQQPND